LLVATKDIIVLVLMLQDYPLSELLQIVFERFWEHVKHSGFQMLISTNSMGIEYICFAGIIQEVLLDVFDCSVDSKRSHTIMNHPYLPSFACRCNVGP
jgi:hypothetical protein